ncbi:MAG: helix-turn-helix domain-containing protein [Gemmatimonadetes bacterium]|nr:helix-turn-helix domain-containing protein [Gemmatimonadota bacterium]
MKDDLFNELVGSIQEAGAYLRGEGEPSAVSFAGEPDPKAIRTRLGLTQEEFAAALCISVKTLRNWEQGRREPSGPAMRLLQIAERHPEVLLEAAA